LLKKPRWQVLGINSGTSIDALDFALMEIGEGPQRHLIRLIETHSYRCPKVLREMLANLADSDSVSKEQVARAHFALGEWIAGRVLDFSQKRRTGGAVDLIASHGQTIGHFPSRGDPGGIRSKATWQIGSPAVIAHRTGVVTVGDFRSADIAAGGIGAPLSGYYHSLLFGKDHVVLNLGGIANVSAARTRKGRREILAFDVGPANMMIDALARATLGKPYDPSGRVGASGTPDWQLVRRILGAPYFHRKPPKTCGREEFGPHAIEDWFLRDRGGDPSGRPHAGRGRTTGLGKGTAPARIHRAAILLATAMEVTAAAISRAAGQWVEPFVPTRSLILVGGGTKNRALIRRIAELLPGWTVSTSDEWGMPAQYVEPAGFAVLAYETLRGRPGNLGGATGARPAILGSISLPY
jgi:anhydro-N-acetylmuramic acid kinase